MANENEDKNYIEHSFSINKPLDDEDRRIMKERIETAIVGFFDIMAGAKGCLEGNDEDSRLKRVYMYLSKVSSVFLEVAERSGSVIVLDKGQFLAQLTAILTPAPAMLEEFAFDILKKFGQEDK